MTSSSRPDSRRSTARRPHGFTLIELLVVMGIILVLISILLPAINRAHRNAVRISMMGDMSVISQALDQYRNDFGDYPRTGLGTAIGSTTANTPVTGAAVLCWALVGPGPLVQDGFGLTTGTDTGAPGFRLRPTQQGQVYGPYISLDRFRIGTVATGAAMTSNTVSPVASGATFDDTTCVLADRNGNIILYFPGNTTVSASAKALVGTWPIGTPPPPQAVYNFNDNSTKVTVGALIYPPYIAATSTTTGQSTLTTNIFAYRLGHTNLYAGSSTASGSATGPLANGEVPVVVPYLLWSAGPDGQFGPQVSSSYTTGEDDDVVYPDQLLSVPAGKQH